MWSWGLVWKCDIIWPCFICSATDHESHEDAITTEIIEELQPAKVPLLPKDIVNSKKVHALRKEQKRKLGKQRSMGSPMDYSPLPIDKHEPEFVSIQRQFDHVSGSGFKATLWRIFDFDDSWCSCRKFEFWMNWWCSLVALHGLWKASNTFSTQNDL